MPKKKARDRQKSIEIKNGGNQPLDNSKSTKESHHHFVHHRHHHHSSQSDDGNGNGVAISSAAPEPSSSKISPLPKPSESNEGSEFKECLDPKEFVESQKITEPAESAESEEVLNPQESLNSEVRTENKKPDVSDETASPDSAEPLNVSPSDRELQNMPKTESEVTADSFETASGRSFSSISLSSEISIGKGYSLNSLAGLDAPIKEEPDSIPMAMSKGEHPEKKPEKVDSSLEYPTVPAPEVLIEELKREGEEGDVDSSAVNKGEDTQNRKHFPVKSKGEEMEGGDLPAKEETTIEGNTWTSSARSKSVAWFPDRSTDSGSAIGGVSGLDDIAVGAQGSERIREGRPYLSACHSVGQREGKEGDGKEQSAIHEPLKNESVGVGNSESPTLVIPQRSFAKFMVFIPFARMDSVDVRVQKKIKKKSFLIRRYSSKVLGVDLWDEIVLTPPSPSRKHGGLVGEEGCREEKGLESTRSDQNLTPEKEAADTDKDMGEETVRESKRFRPKTQAPCFWVGWWISQCFDSDDET